MDWSWEYRITPSIVATVISKPFELSYRYGQRINGLLQNKIYHVHVPLHATTFALRLLPEYMIILVNPPLQYHH
jgi:hypothetical protein